MTLIDRDRLLSERMRSKYYHLPNGDTAIPIIDIENAPTVEPMQWIPCSSGRMPEDLEEVNITWINHDPAPYYDAIKDKPFTASAVYYKGKWYWWVQYAKDLLSEYGDRCELAVMHIDEAIEVIAWQPLPAPYKGVMQMAICENCYWYSDVGGVMVCDHEHDPVNPDNEACEYFDEMDDADGYNEDDLTSDMRDYCERYEPTYNPEDGSM